jgi:OmpA-OmpF porin, OOP family
MKSSIRALSLAVASALLIAASAWAQPVTLGQKADRDGVISARAGTSLRLKTKEGDLIVVLTDNTDVKATKGRLGLLKSEVAATALIPGLKVEIEGMGDDKGHLVATKVRFTKGDLETARAIEAGLTETTERLDATNAKVDAHEGRISKVESDQAELAHRFGQLGEYDVKDEATLYFGVGSAALSAEAEAELARLSAGAKGLKGYLIGVEGYADATGGATVNQKLSLERSQAVVNWLAQKGGIPFVRMLAPGAMSTAAPVASNETDAGRAQNRRVVVRVLLNRGLAEP